MDYKQSATPSGRWGGLFCPNWSSRETIERLQKARFKKRLPFAPDATAEAFPAQLRQITRPIIHPRIFCELVSCCRRARRQLSLAPFIFPSGLTERAPSRSRDRPTLMLLRLQPADNDIRQGFSEAVDPLRRNPRGVHAPHGRVNRVPYQSTGVI
jgi:hypothetical protein